MGAKNDPETEKGFLEARRLGELGAIWVTVPNQSYIRFACVTQHSRLTRIYNNLSCILGENGTKAFQGSLLK